MVDLSHVKPPYYAKDEMVGQMIYKFCHSSDRAQLQQHFEEGRCKKREGSGGEGRVAEILMVNLSHVKSLYYAKDEIVGLMIYKFCHSSDRAQLEQHFEEGRCKRVKRFVIRIGAGECELFE